MRTLAAMTAHGQLVASRYGESVRRNRVEEHALGRTAVKLDDDVVDERQPLFRLVRKDLLFGALDVELQQRYAWKAAVPKDRADVYGRDVCPFPFFDLPTPL